MKNIFLKTFFWLTLIIFCLSFNESLAVSIFWQGPQEIKQGESFEVNLFLDPQGFEINAVEGKIVLPQGFEPVSVDTGNSLVSLWIERPEFKGFSEIVFSGIIPGGYQGELSAFWDGFRPGKIVGFVFDPQESGNFSLLSEDLKVFLNDGLGTKVDVASSGFQGLIKQGVSVSSLVSPIDETAPEFLNFQVLKDENLFDGQAVLIFSVQDKGSGVDYYLVREQSPYFFDKLNLFHRKFFYEAESPYLLRDQDRRSLITLVAVDNAGNKSSVNIEPLEKITWYQDYSIWSIMFLGIILVFFLWSSKFLLKKFF